MCGYWPACAQDFEVWSFLCSLEPNYSESMAAMTQLLVLVMAGAAALCMSISVHGWSLEEIPYDGPNTIISDRGSSPHFSRKLDHLMYL